EVNNYMYSIGEKGLYINMYGGSTLNTELHDGSTIKLDQTTNYPWDGKIVITIKEATDKPVNIYLRIPGWSKGYSLKINNSYPKVKDRDSGFVIAGRKWNAGDKIELDLTMPVTLIESNPLVEETRNRVAVKRGPVVYCLESTDLPGKSVFDIVLPASIKLQPVNMKVADGNVVALTGQARVLQRNDWKNTLYKELNTNTQPVAIKLIPYYAWANRGKTDMTVWLPVAR
ncbi:MAG: glycoside hydrolase family 127 protein, partial [Chitinophagaceae bacterium]|nr:glycoside hydrolase family 127 protein [Chitinophagaceae bacterium]